MAEAPPPYVVNSRVMRNTGKDGPPNDGSRAGSIWHRLKFLAVAVYEDHFLQSGADETKRVSIDLYSRVREAAIWLRQNSANQEWVSDFERQVIQPLASEMRRHLLRNHLTVAKPVWATNPSSRILSSVFFSGSTFGRQHLVAASKRNGLTVQELPRNTSYATARWNGLRTSEVAVFDYLDYPHTDERDGLSFSAASTFATTSYELGMALAIGHPILILTDNPDHLPFDIDITPLTVLSNAIDITTLSEALDEVIYGVQRNASGSSLKATRAWLQHRFHGHHLNSVASPLDALDDSINQNSVKFRSYVESILGWAGDTQAQILYPSWPGDYPDASRQKLFHVMPFRPLWNSRVREVVATACQSSGRQVQYVRGDQPLERNILRSIWTELCTATYVLVDLTGMNPNVALELGIADTLGRNTLLVSQDGPSLFQNIQKERIHSYTLESSGINQLKRDNSQIPRQRK